MSGGPAGLDEFDPELLRTAMRRAGYTVEQLAGRAGLVRQSLSAILNGRRQPTAATVRRLAEAAGVPVSELLTPLTPDLRGLRLATGLTQDHAAAAAALTRSTYAALETGRIEHLGAERAAALAAAFGTDTATVDAAHRQTRARSRTTGPDGQN